MEAVDAFVLFALVVGGLSLALFVTASMRHRNDRSQAAKCRRCGQTLPSHARFCRQCGQGL